MSVGTAAQLMQSGIFQILLLAAPVLLIAVTVGLIISIFQATTSIQEQTITFVPKIAAIMGSLIFFGPWMLNTLKQYAIAIISMIPDMAK